MDAWYDCNECIFATNSPKAAAAHTTKTGHEVNEEQN